MVVAGDPARGIRRLAGIATLMPVEIGRFAAGLAKAREVFRGTPAVE
jgi:hypothetical protein